MEYSFSICINQSLTNNSIILLIFLEETLLTKVEGMKLWLDGLKPFVVVEIPGGYMDRSRWAILFRHSTKEMTQLMNKYMSHHRDKLIGREFPPGPPEKR